MNLRLKNIHKRYLENTVLNGYSYDFEKGLYLLVGSNGIGKSTLLKIISGVIKPSNINYMIDKDKVAYLCEKIELANINVLCFLKMICKINNTTFDIEDEVKRWKIPNKNINNLSKGNKQKTALLMMRFTEADVYLFDEPTDALDQEGITLFQEMIAKLVDEGKTIIISSHEKNYFKDFSYKELGLS